MRFALIAAAVVFAACSPAANTNAAPAGSAGTTQIATSPVSASAPSIVAAIADTHRPDADRARDAARHPAETLAFAEVQPGQKIGELLPGEGYFTRLFSSVVGANGHVYPVSRSATDQYEHTVLVGTPNVTNVIQPYDAYHFPEQLDLVFTAQNYHDMKILQYHMGSTIDMNRMAFAALKPGGHYVIIDHVAATGSQENQEHPLHRIDPAVVRREVESVGFVYDGEMQILRNPADPHTASVFDPSIRGHTDQFAMRFRKPS